MGEAAADAQQRAEVLALAVEAERVEARAVAGEETGAMAQEAARLCTQVPSRPRRQRRNPVVAASISQGA